MRAPLIIFILLLFNLSHLKGQDILKAYGNKEINIFYHAKFFESHKAYFVLGSENDRTPTITKIDQNGNIIWSKKYSGQYHSFELGEIEVPGRNTTDIIVTLSDFGSYNDLYIMRINGDNGAVIWNKKIKYNSENRFSNFVITKDNYIIAATTVRYSGGVFFVKMDINGNIIWSKLFNKSGGFQKTSNFVPDNDNGFVFGFTNGISGLIGVDFNGNVKYIHKTNNYTHIRSITKHPTNGFVISSYLNWDKRATNNELIYVDNNYNIVWKKIINPNSSHNGDCVDCASPYSIINTKGEIIHIRESAISGTVRFNFSKFDQNGNHISSVYGNNNDIQFISSGFGAKNQLFSLGSTTRAGLCLNNTKNGLFTLYTENNNICDTRSFTPLVSNSTTTFTLENKNIITVTTPSYIETVINTIAIDNQLNARNLCSNQVDKVYIGEDFITCNSNPTYLNAGTGYKSYLWSNGLQTPTIQISSTGTYWVKVIDECDNESSDTIKVTFASNKTINNPVSLCPAQTYTINGHTYSAAGTYRDTLKTLQGCDSIVVTTITLKSAITVNNTQSICQGQSIKVGNKTYTSTGTYRDTLKTSFGCDSIIVTNLTVNPVFSRTNTISICQGDSVKVGNKYYYLEGNYIDTLKTIFGCDSIINSQIKVLNSTTEEVSLIICPGESVEYNGKTYDTPGTYQDIIKNSKGCDSIITNIYVENMVEPLIELGKDTTICSNVQFEIGAEYSDATYLWNTGSEEAFIEVQESGIYTLTISNRCFSTTDTISVELLDCDCKVFVPNAFSPNGDGKNDELIVKEENIIKSKLIIYNKWGEEVFETSNHQNVWNGIHKEKHLAPDVYGYYYVGECLQGNKIELKGNITIVR